MEAYLINPIARKPRKKKKGKTMARKKKSGSRKKLYGAALKAWRKKRGLKGGMTRANPAKTAKKSKRKAAKKKSAPKRKKRHNVSAHSRAAHSVTGYKRKKSSVRKHMSNPFKLPSYRGVIGDLQAGAIAAVALGGAFYASRMIGNLASRYVPGAHAGIPRFLVKLGVATATVWAAKQVTRDPGLRKVVLAGAYFPLVVETVAMVAPGVAMQMAVVPALPAPAAASGVSAYLGMPPGDRLSDYTLNAELEAELETDSEFGIY